MEIIRFALLGLGTGSLYALAALGIVLVFRASGVLNFASGITGGFAAFVFYDLRDTHHLNWIIALGVSVAVGAALGAATHLLVMAPLRKASALVKLIATLGVLLFVQGAVVLVWGSDQHLVTSILPTAPVRIAHSLTIGKDRIVLIGLLAVLAVVLRVVYSRTRFGLATTAVAENRRTAAASGWSTSTIELVNWTVGGALYAIAAIFLAPISGLSAGSLTLLVVPALAAALVGGFSSFLLTIAGAMLIGVAQAETGRYSHVTGLADSIPFLLIIVILVVGGKARPARGDLPVRLPLPGPGRINLPFMVVATGLGGLLIWALPAGWVAALSVTLITAVLVLSVVVVTGYAGQLSLSQWALAGFGAWVAARLVAASGLPFWLAAIIGIAAAVPAGLIVALPALRTRGVNLAVATLGLALVIQSMILNNGGLTGGLDGTQVGAPSLFGVDLDPIVHPRRYATLVLVMLVLLGLLVANVRRGRTGRRLLAIRGNERAAASIGVGVYGAKLYAFGLGAGIGAVAGILTAFQSPSVVFSQFDVFGSINVVMYAVIGGIGWASGSLAGATMIAGGIAAKVVSSLGDISGWLPLIAGAGVILTLIAAPDGIAKLNSDGYRALVARVRGLRGRDEQQASTPAGAGAGARPAVGRVHRSATLEVRNLSVRFGGVQALDDVSLHVEPGQVVGLIGPNGAGKTTWLDIVTGFTRPTSGEVLLDGRSIAGWSPVRRARAGLARSFQAVELFPDMTVRDNLLAAADTQAARYYLRDLVRPGVQHPTEIMDDVIDELGLRGLLDAMPSELPHGRARLVGVARALVADPAVLFLDEPAAGLDTHESEEIGTVIRQIAERRNTAVLLIEHDIPLVLGICDRIAVLDFGRLIAEGTPAEIRTNPDVIRAYLGEEPADSASAGDQPPAHAARRPVASRNT